MGRGSLKDEVLRTKVIDLAWRTLWKALSTADKVDDRTKIAIARDIASKTVPQEHKLTVDRVITYMSNINRDAIDVTPEQAEWIPIDKPQDEALPLDTASD